MDGLALTITAPTASTSSSFSIYRIPFCSFSFITRRRVLKARNFWKKPSKFVVLASKDEPKLDPLDQMELKFGRMLGEDPKLTLAKIMGRKANPDASYIEIEKSFYKNKGKIPEVKEVPIDWSNGGQSSKSLDGLNLFRPVPKKGFEIKDDDKAIVPKIKKPIRSDKAMDGVKRSVPNVILRKPTMFNEPDVEDKPSRLRLRPNLSLATRNEQRKEVVFTDMTLLRKPEPVSVNDSTNRKEENSGDQDPGVVGDMELKTRKEDLNDGLSAFTLLEKPSAVAVKTELESSHQQFANSDYVDSDVVDATGNEGLSELTGIASAALNKYEESEDSSLLEKPTRLQPDEQSVLGSIEEIAEKEFPGTSSGVSNVNLSAEASLIGKPKRLDQTVKETSFSLEFAKEPAEFENLPVTSPVEGLEDADWTRAEDLVKTGDRGEVELISCSSRGFVVSFGSLIGFLPYRNLSAKWKFLAFESWLRRKGLDPSLYRQNLGVIGHYEAASNNPLLDSSLDPDIDMRTGGEISSDMKVEELLRIYDQEKIKFLQSFVGQKLKVNVLLANRKSGKLLFSVKPKEKEELVEKKRSLMAKLQVGDIVKCCIKKITYFGIFVEVDGVPALIHQTEVSWDATLDPAAYFKVGQIVEAKVHQLDFTLDRIFLSLKEIMPDPLIDTLESVVGDRDPLDGRLNAAEADSEWTDVESLIKELQQIEGIQSVSKGRFFLSPGLAPTFQVYLASMFENQYKLLARSGNKVQEVIVQTSLDKERLKSAILSCTNRVE
ncbi:Polyribonucleotide nucleotidyltransferase [Parasponia andersonii]|uniref:Polyribonucleotide nucleotidyltransferase n=1 Tax=Parasponia andersonii TaxID=3476 RepID=A0A2P5CP75_PARAD|nr:Polyribonucleotide nucleotidyltransferase [Parasponia andersonii]